MRLRMRSVQELLKKQREIERINSVPDFGSVTSMPEEKSEASQRFQRFTFAGGQFPGRVEGCLARYWPATSAVARADRDEHASEVAGQ
jgi:hypothetical protein